jgi:hypothetical protein
MKKEKIKEYKGFKVGEKIIQKGRDKWRTFGECIIKEFDLTYGEDVLIFVPTYGEDENGKQDGYIACVDLSEISKLE